MKPFKRKLWLVPLAAVILVFIAMVSGKRNGAETVRLNEGASESAPSLAVDGSTEESVYWYVYVTGAVREEGVYAVHEGDRVFEVIEKAGGLTEDACLNGINQAETVYDGMHLHIPRTGEEADNLSGYSGSRLVNVNTSGTEELMTLPGIGKAKAEAIVAYRKEHGRFASIEDLINVPGIGAGILENIRAYIRI